MFVGVATGVVGLGLIKREILIEPFLNTTAFVKNLTKLENKSMSQHKSHYVKSRVATIQLPVIYVK